MLTLNTFKIGCGHYNSSLLTSRDLNSIRFTSEFMMEIVFHGVGYNYDGTGCGYADEDGWGYGFGNGYGGRGGMYFWGSFPSEDREDFDSIYKFDYSMNELKNNKNMV